MSDKDDELYIGSISPTIDVRQQRGLLKVTKDMMPMLTVTEWMEIMNVYDTASPTYAEDPPTKDNSIRPVRYAIPDDMNSFICKVSDLGIGDVFYDDISEFYFTVEFTKKLQSKEFGVPDTVCSVIGSTSSSTYCPFERKYVVPYDRTVRKVDDIILQMEGDEENELG